MKKFRNQLGLLAKLFTKQRVLVLFLIAVLSVGQILPVAGRYISLYQYSNMSQIDKDIAAQALTNLKRTQDRKPIVKSDQFKLADGVKDKTIAPVSDAGKATQAKEPVIEKSPDLGQKKSEDVNLRTANSSTFKTTSGVNLTEVSASEKNYQDTNGNLQPISNRVSSDTDYAAKNKAQLNQLKIPDVKSSTPFGFRAESGSIKTYFETIGAGGIRMEYGSNQLSMSPVTSQNVKPDRIQQRDQDLIQYKNVWENVDLVYEYKGTSVKENIVINSLPKSSKFVFDLSGAKASSNPDGSGGLLLDGAFKDKLAIGSLSINVNNKGLIENPPVKEYAINDGTQVVIELDQAWLNSQTKDAYPIVIDPPIVDTDSIPGGMTGLFTAYKSDGYACSSTYCNVNAGGLVNSGNKFWRTVFRIPYDQVVGRQILAADLYVPMMTTPGWHGTYDNRTVYVSWANCNGFNCIGTGPQASASVGADGTIDVTSLMQWMIANVSTGGSLIIWGEEWNNSSFKEFNPGSIQLYLYTNQYPSLPAPQLPSTNSAIETTVTSTDPQLKVTQSTDGNSDPVHYEFAVKNTNGNVIWSSGMSASRQAIIPDGILQDGGHYIWQYRYGDYAGTGYYWISDFLTGGSFKVDLLTDKNDTQTYDNYGPISTSLNSGKLYSSVKTHSMTALGGDIGLTLNYNSPYLTKSGLQAEYWTNADYNGSPSYRRIEPSINNDWDLGSPVTGVIPPDYFSVRWNGYFVAPVAGDYTFGSDGDDYMSMTVNGNTMFSNNTSGLHWSSTSVHLEAGEPAEIYVWFSEYSGNANAKLKVKGAVPEQTVPGEWLKTNAVPTEDVSGLAGHYYYDSGTHTEDPNTEFLSRNDPTVNFTWGAGSAVPGAPSDNFIVQWKGYFTAPVAGTYKFGVGSDDGSRVTVDGTERANLWSTHAYTELYDSTGLSLSAGQTVPISMEYYETTGDAKVKLLLDGPTGIGEIDSQYLTHTSNELPIGWQLSGDIDQKISYEKLSIQQNGDAIVSDGDGIKRLFQNTGTGYTSPSGENGILTKNTDGTHTLTAANGSVYVFSIDGLLQLASSPIDDKNPASLQYEYTTVNGVPKLKKIIDQVNTTRFGTLYYGGDTGCRDPYDGLDQAPTGMLCGFETTDGQYTQFMYSDAKMTTVSKPGYDDTILVYDSNGTLSGFRDSLSEDAVYAGQRPDDEFSYTWLWYDALGRSRGYQTQKPTSGGSEIMHYIEFLPNATRQHTVGDTEPAGYNRYIEYDNLLRTTKDCDKQGLCTTIEYDPNKNLVLSTTDALGLKSTNIYDDSDRLVQSYGAAPSAWFDATTRLPLSTYASSVPTIQSAYDEGIVGPDVAYYNYEGNITPSGKLFGAPKLHTNGINTSPGILSKTWTSSPVTVDSGREGWGVSITGEIRLPSSGTYQIKASHDDGVKIWIDDKLVVDDWSNGNYRDSQGSFTHDTGKVHRLKIEYYNVDGTATNDATLNVYLQQVGGFTWTNDWTNYLKPGYGYITSTTLSDNQSGNTTSTTSYADPAYGIGKTGTVDPSGLNLQVTKTSESVGTGYFREISKTLPAGNTTTYQYWGATDTSDNPCTTGVTEAFKQAGLLKGRTDPDPDGSSPAVARTTQTIYDDSGRTVANRIGSDAWTCVSYDDHGRIAEIDIPTVGSRTGRTVTYDYANGGNPLSSTATDNSGTTTNVLDLLGRTVQYTDVSGNVTDLTYDNFDKVTQRTGQLGTETYTYDNYGRLTHYDLDGVRLANVTYDSFGRANQVEYPSIKDPTTNQTLKLNAPTRDSLQRLTGVNYTLPNNSQVSDQVTLSQSGTVLDDSVNGVDLSPGVQGFTYDKAGRLTQANIAGHSYGYSFGTQNSACSTKTGDLSTAGKNSNRMAYTVDGVTSWYCYDQADRLIASSDANVDAATYDSHGNTLTLGTGTNVTTFKYDQGDRNIEIQQGSTSKVTYDRDTENRVTKRTVTSGGTTTSYYYGNTGGADYSFMYTNPTTKQVVEKYITLPGGVNMTLRPLETTVANKSKGSLTNIHGDVLVTTDGNGVNDSGVLLYEPFGTQISAASPFIAANPSMVFAGLTPASNQQGGQSAGWAGEQKRSDENIFTLKPIQMGSRVYIPGLGRFLNVDPIEGGTPNNYIYTPDPINSQDYNGDAIWQDVIPAIVSALAAIVSFVKLAGPAIVSGATAVAQFAQKASQAISGLVTAIKVASTASKVERAAETTSQTAIAAQKGYQGMKAANVIQNTVRIPSLTNTASYRIPDGMTLNTIAEVKNVAYQPYTRQLLDFNLYTQTTGQQFVLYIRQGAKLSSPLQKEVEKGLIRVVEVQM
ncbi:MAG TPA: PA14 domain-containing protein [Candidatus Microsaccharimonas sp.]|jgi:RHS repeat-associated protein